MGDRILKVNGTDVTHATHQEAVMELLRPGDEIRLTIRHDPLPEGFQVYKSCIMKINFLTELTLLKLHPNFLINITNFEHFRF